MVTFDRERLISEKPNNKASPEGARLPKEAMLLRDIFKFTKPSLDVMALEIYLERNCGRLFLSALYSIVLASRRFHAFNPENIVQYSPIS